MSLTKTDSELEDEIQKIINDVRENDVTPNDFDGSFPLYNMWRSRSFIIDLLKYRSYELTDEDDMTYTEFKTWNSERENYDPADELDGIHEFMTMNYIKNEQPIVVYWKKELKIGTDHINELYTRLSQDEIYNCIIVKTINTTVSPSAISAIKNLKIQKVYIEIISFEDTLYNPVTHVLNSEMSVVPTKMKNELIGIYGGDADKLPKIKPTDPQIRYMNAKKGQLIKIKRKSVFVPGEYTLSYRLVK